MMCNRGGAAWLGGQRARFSVGRFFLEAQAHLPSWVGYQSRNGPYGSISSDEPSDGVVTIVVEPEGGKESPLTEQDRASVQWWLDHEAEVASAVLEGLLAEYPRLQQDYGYEGAERETYMPDVSRTEEFRQLIGLHNVHFVPLLKEGLPYVGYEFGCTWDGEHGLGVLTHGSRVVEVGGADTAFTLWIAKQDAHGDATG
jgi:hypothetical protein